MQTNAQDKPTNALRTVNFSDLTPEILAELGDEPLEDYSVIQIDPVTREVCLAERYRKRLDRETGEYVVWLNRFGLENSAGYVANCYAHATVYKQCPKKHVAMAYHYRCHDFGCNICGRGSNLFYIWLRNRNIDRIVSEPQTALELTLPRQGTLREDRNRMKDLATKLIKKLGIDSISHDGIDPNSKNINLRVMLKEAASASRRKWVRREWKSIAGPLASCTVRRVEAGEPVKETLKWLFAGTEPILSLPGRVRAEIRRDFQGCRFVRTTGNFYSPLSPEDLEAQKEEHRRHSGSDVCPVCQDGKPLETIPVGSRVMEPVEQITATYRRVYWRSEFGSPHDNLRGLIAKGSRLLSDNLGAASDSEPRLSRYGPN